MVMGLAYLSTAFSVIGPGEVGWVLRFGRVVRTVSEPRLIVHLPLPFDRVKRLRPQAVRRVELGLAQQPGDMLEKIPWAADRGMTSDGLQWMSMRQELAAEAEVITGDENIISIQYAVHFDIRDPYVYQYRFVDPEEVVRALAAWVLRQAVARHAATDILVAQRVALERESLDLLQDELDAIGIGVRIIAVTLQDVHAAPPVHAAFRDVASALEDKARKTRQAQGYRSEGEEEAEKIRAQADREQAELLNEARRQAEVMRGEADAEATRIYTEAFSQDPEFYEFLRSLKAYETMIQDTSTVVLPSDSEILKVLKHPGHVIPTEKALTLKGRLTHD
jgi:regulator of protease activity HflC (stomatin/prohibitin superfamily)